MENFNDLFKNLGIKNPFDKNLQTHDLSKILKYKLKNKNKDNLEEILYNNIKELYKNKETLKLSIRSSLLIGDLKLAYNLSQELPHSEARAIIEYQNEKYLEASKSFKNSKNIKPNMRILYSISHYNFIEEINDIHDEKIYKKILKPIIETSDKANSILGTVYFNNSSFKKAEHYFKRAKEMNKSEINYINLFKIQNLIGNKDEIYNDVNNFFINTSSNLSSNEFENKINQTEIKLPKIKISNLYAIVSKLI